LTEKKELKKKNQVNLKTTKFPSLIDLKNIKKDKCSDDQDETNYKVAASYTEEQLREIKKEKDKQKNKKSFEGWVQLQNNNGSTIISDLNKHGKKKKIEDIGAPEEYNHEEFQAMCAKAMYSNLQYIQSVRDEENEILGPHSRYYNKGSLTDLSYLSDSDVEMSDDDNNTDNDAHQDYYSDCDTY
jgi:hypothetical protein